MANWNTVDPIIVTDPPPKVLFEESGGRDASVRVRVRFTDDTTPTPNTREKDYIVSGANARADLAKLVHRDRETLQGSGSLTPGAITPVAPTAVEAAIAAYQLASARFLALAKLQARLGIADGDQIGTSGLTVTQVRTSLQNTMKADLTNQARITVALDNTI